MSLASTKRLVFEMVVEHKRLAGQDKVLEAAKRFADHVDSVFSPGKRYDVPGHEEVELALVKLYRATGEKRYLDLCRFFLDERGHAARQRAKAVPPPCPIVVPKCLEGQTMVEYRRAKWGRCDGRMPDHEPLIKQNAIGHAVRAGYVYSHENIEANHGKVSLMRGPIVYCYEAADNPGVDFSKTILPNRSAVQAEHRAELLGGITAFKTKKLDEKETRITLTAIPYYAWTNRKKGPMTVWTNETPGSISK